MFNPPVEDGQVLVYKDWCDECVSVHYLEHHPRGVNVCKVTVNKSPAYYYAGQRAGVQKYNVKYSASLSVELPVSPWLQAMVDEHENEER
jgi:hypothetical protein